MILVGVNGRKKSKASGLKTYFKAYLSKLAKLSKLSRENGVKYRMLVV